MYKCPFCKKVQAPKTGQVKVVLQTRQKRYENKVKVNKVIKTIESLGTEIVQELGICPPCAKARKIKAT